MNPAVQADFVAFCQHAVLFVRVQQGRDRRYKKRSGNARAL